jgi:two-component system sensor histidine kinase CiaH
MPNVLKPFGGKATDSRKDRFWSARAQLTLTYTAILAVILCISSSIIYSAFSNRLAHRFGRFPPRQPIHLSEGVAAPRPEDVLRDLTKSLILVNSLLLILAAALSYWLAGVTLAPIQELYERQRRFLSDASHELRTPLAILQADLENILSNQTISVETREQAKSHLEEVARMTALVKDLLLLSQVDETAISEELKKSVDLPALLQTTIDRFEAFATQHDVLLIFSSAIPTFHVITQESLLTQALGNIVKNAITYNKPQGTVQIQLEKDSTHARIRIQDTGIGISKENVDKIFDRFYRVDKSRSRLTGGSGLGLAITRTIIEQLHGSLELKSELGQGTIMTITLPLSRPS